MWTFLDLIKNFFTHKDFLPPADKLPGTMFTPLHIVFAIISVALVVTLGLYVSRKSEKTIRRVLFVLWIVIVALEFTKMIWETVSGAQVNFEWGGMLPLYPCSVFMYAMPLALFGKGILRRAGCGYMCTLGLIGGSINFVYPATILSNYSCISFAGFHTFLYHGAIVFTALVMLRSGYHSYRKVTKWWELFVPALPFFATSIVANIVNFSKIGSDYMFFKLNSFIFAPIGAATPDWLAVIIVYLAYAIIHAAFYLPSYISNLKAKKTA